MKPKEKDLEGAVRNRVVGMWNALAVRTSTGRVKGRGIHAVRTLTGQHSGASNHSLIALEPFSASAQNLSVQALWLLGDSRYRIPRCSAILGTGFLVARRFSVHDSLLLGDSR
ncbi:unnamed protein product [Cochlearia groenlandica]